MSNLLKKLGDNWHTEDAYIGLIESIVPNSEHKKAIQNLLLELYVDEHNDYKLFRSKGTHTIYDDDIVECSYRKKETEEALEKEEKHFKKLLEKFQQMEAPETSTEEEVDEEDEEEEVVEVSNKGKGQKACKRTIKSEAKHKAMLVKGIKTSMASSQEKLRDLNEYIQQLDKKAEFFTYYQKASQQYQRSTREDVQKYIQSKDLEQLIRDLDASVGYYEMMMRRYVPKMACRGEEKGICETHLLPLSMTVYPNEGFKRVWKCKVAC